jgi:3-methyladenine DNA glycosylase AlkD
MHLFLHDLDHELQMHADKKNASNMEKYMRNLFPFFGISSPVRKEILRTLIKKHGLPPKENIQNIITFCWDKPEREYQMIGMELAGKYLRNPEVDDIVRFEQMIVRKSWWDSVDYIAATLVGNYFLRFQEKRTEIMHRWISDGNIWLQRTTLIFQLKYKEKTDTGMLEQNILALQPNKEFFINKAAGWALREYSKTNPKWVVRFLETHQLTPLCRREALKWLNRK